MINNDEISISAWFYKNANDTTNADAIFSAYRWSRDIQLNEGFDLRFYQVTPDTLDFILITQDGSGNRTKKTAKKLSVKIYTTSTCQWCMKTKEFFKELVEFCHKNNIIACHDSAYSEVYNGEKPISILEIDGASEIAIEFHSLSKTFNMTGFRIGFACGNEKLISGLGKVKTNLDSGQFQAIQLAAITALDNYNEITPKINEIYDNRRKIVIEGLKNMGFATFPSKATFYVWSKVPEGYNSVTYCQYLLEKASIVVTPGSGFGKAGEGYFRVSLTQNTDRLKEAVSRIRNL